MPHLDNGNGNGWLMGTVADNANWTGCKVSSCGQRSPQQWASKWVQTSGHPAPKAKKTKTHRKQQQTLQLGQMGPENKSNPMVGRRLLCLITKENEHQKGTRMPEGSQQKGLPQGEQNKHSSNLRLRRINEPVTVNLTSFQPKTMQTTSLQSQGQTDGWRLC
jgi:hypothetical protein